MKKYLKNTNYYFLIIYTLFVMLVSFYAVSLSKTFVFNSDTVDVMMWAKTAYESGHLINPDFSYAAIIPFGVSLLMLLFIPFFGISYTSMVLGMLAFVFLLYLALIAFFKTIGLSSKWICIALISLSALMLCSTKMREMFLQHAIYYSLSLLFILVGLTLSIKLIEFIENGNKKKAIIFSVILCVFMILVATDGIVVLSMSTIPIVMALIFRCFFDFKKTFTSKENHSSFFAILLIGISTLVGLFLLLFISKSTTAPYANAYSALASSEQSSKWVSLLERFFSEWYYLFEVIFYHEKSLFSFDNIAMLIRFAFASLILIAPFATLPFYKKIKDKNLKLSLWVQLSIIAIIAFMWFFGSINTANWRLIPIAGFGVIFLVQLCAYLFKDKFGTRRIAIIIMAILLIFSIFPQFYLIAYTPNGKYGYYQPLVTELEKREVTYGYADFWDANAITILSSNKIKAKNYKYSEDKNDKIILQKHCYQQDENSVFKGADENEKYFVMISNEFNNNITNYFYENSINILDKFDYIQKDITVYIIDKPLALSE
ncbi:MAG: hypothetical protein RR552_08175 [Oscillospiraceae bacterium]